jgi:hypothetical protein
MSLMVRLIAIESPEGLSRQKTPGFVDIRSGLWDRKNTHTRFPVRSTEVMLFLDNDSLCALEG